MSEPYKILYTKQALKDKGTASEAGFSDKIKSILETGATLVARVFIPNPVGATLVAQVSILKPVGATLVAQMFL